MARTDTFTLRVNPEERRMIDALARKLERSQSDAIRVVLRKAAVDSGAWFERPETERYRGRSSVELQRPSEDV